MARSTVAAPEVAEIAARLPAGAARGTSRAAIAAAVAAIVERFGPRRVVLFGSRATGTARPTSDVDLLVVLDFPEPTPRGRMRQGEAIRAAVGAVGPVRLHPTVRTPRQVRAALAGGDFFVEDAVRQGVTLFGDDEDEAAEEAGDAAATARKEPSWEEWVVKAEGDDRAAARMAAPPAEPDLVCFLSQQGAEKWLKALLQQHGIRFGRTHDLAELADAATSILPGLAAREDDLKWLTDYAVGVRYPGLTAGTEDAERALAIAGEVRRLAREALGLAG